MSRIDDIFTRLRSESRTALMPFVTAGFPDLETTERVLPELAQAGASIVELGIPFSDPIADGPVIASSMHTALEGGVTPRAILELVRAFRGAQPDNVLGVIAMVSHSIVARMGLEKFFADLKGAGFDGVILPDMDLAVAEDLVGLAEKHDLAMSLLVAPTSTPARVREIVGHCRGFVYLLARAGLTGEQDDAPEIAGRVELVRSHTKLPVAVGFGISTAAHVAQVTQHADAAIVGSALVRRMADADDPAEVAVSFTRELAGGLARRA